MSDTSDETTGVPARYASAYRGGTEARGDRDDQRGGGDGPGGGGGPDGSGHGGGPKGRGPGGPGGAVRGARGRDGRPAGPAAGSGSGPASGADPAARGGDLVVRDQDADAGEDDDDDLRPPLQYRFDGPEGAPVVVLGPALGATWHMWDRQLPLLAGRWRVLRYELPGHGGAPAEPASSVDDLARRLLAVLDDEGIDAFAYAGCSLGAAIGARLALLRPDRVAALALVSAAARFTAGAWRQRAAAVRADGLDGTAHGTPERWFTPAFVATQPAITQWAVTMVATTDQDCYVAACEALAAFDVRDGLGGITVPTLVVAGADDAETPPADARQLVAGIPDARLAVVPATGHLAPVEEPAAVGELLAHHFDSAWAERTAVPAPFAPAPPPVPPRAQGRPAAAPAGPDHHAEGLRIRRELTGPPAAAPGLPAGVSRHAARAALDAGPAAGPGIEGPADPGGHGGPDGFGAAFDAFAVRYGWGEPWTRPGLDRRTRSFLSLAALTALGQHRDLAEHTRAALRNGLTPAEIEEALLHAAVFTGLPAARAALEAARPVIEQETAAARPLLPDVSTDS